MIIKTKSENFRPVSHIVEVSKLVEYAVLEQTYKHFDENSLFHPNHHGSLPGHNTASAIIQLYDIWLDAAENNEITAALLLDLSAAFDLIGHDILFKKLKLYHFSNGSIEFLKIISKTESKLFKLSPREVILWM